VCKQIEPPLIEYPGQHLAACHHPLSVSESDIAAAKYSELSPLSAGSLMPDRSEARGERQAVGRIGESEPAQAQE
jgi:peptide/nickel transport system ATP-binding protein/oligopeptide transport system ATP-binding protein